MSYACNCYICNGEDDPNQYWACDCPLRRIECSSEVCMSGQDPETDQLIQNLLDRLNGKEKEA